MASAKHLAQAEWALKKTALTYPEAYEESGKLALSLPFASPTEYGLGKSGWVTARFHIGDAVPTDMLAEWVDESYRAIAPKKLVARLEEGDTENTRKKSRRGQKTTKIRTG